MQGSIVFNGNLRFETDFIHRFRDRILSSNHQDPAVQKSRKVLLVTAAWRRDEFDEGHIRQAFAEIGLAAPSDLDQAVENLGVYNAFLEFKEKEPETYLLYHEKQEALKEIKRFYRMSNLRLVGILKEQLQMARERFPDASMAGMLDYPVKERARHLDRMDDLRRLYHHECRQLQHSLEQIRDTDRNMVETCRDIEFSFYRRSRLSHNPLWKAIRKRLEEKISQSSSIFIFGGHTAVLLNRLSFFRLQPALQQALAQGSNFYTISAGSVVLCRTVLLYDDLAQDHGRPQREFEFFDLGFGLVSKVILFPHCRDRISLDDPDNLAYLAHRFRGSACLGLDQESFLLMDTYTQGRNTYERFASVGSHEGVYLFDKSGRKIIVPDGYELALPGTLAQAKNRPGRARAGKGESDSPAPAVPLARPIHLPPLPARPEN